MFGWLVSLAVWREPVRAIPPVRRCKRRSAPCRDFGCEKCLFKRSQRPLEEWTDDQLLLERERQGPQNSWSPSTLSGREEDEQNFEDSLDCRQDLECHIPATEQEQTISPTHIVNEILKRPRLANEDEVAGATTRWVSSSNNNSDVDSSRSTWTLLDNWEAHRWRVRGGGRTTQTLRRAERACTTTAASGSASASTATRRATMEALDRPREVQQQRDRQRQRHE